MSFTGFNCPEYIHFHKNFIHFISYAHSFHFYILVVFVPDCWLHSFLHFILLLRLLVLVVVVLLLAAYLVRSLCALLIFHWHILVECIVQFSLRTI